MTDYAWSEQVATLSGMLDRLQAQVMRGDRAPGLEEFKGAMDDLRLRTWSLLMAANTDDPHGFQEQFRTHRGTQMCQALSADLRTGRLSPGQPDLPGLGEAARNLVAAVKDATRKPAKRRRKEAD